MPRVERAELVQRVQEQNAATLLQYPNVVGTATGYRQRGGRYTNEVCVQALVQRKFAPEELPDWALIPQEVYGGGDRVRVDVIDVGYVYAAQDTTRYRPVPGGCSIGHQNRVDASTLGGWACDNTDDTIVILSCNHCIANLGVASVPGGIVQPGRLDGGVVPGDLIGNLKRFVPITTGVTPLPVTAVDAAIGTIAVGRTDNVLNIGPAVYELRAPALGMRVQKRGRTTQFTNNGRITSVNAQTQVNYGTQQNPVIGLIGNTFIVTSTNQAAFANRGDSGSLIFDQAAGTLNNTRPVVGMFFAVSNAGITTFHNDINVIFRQLNLTTVCDCAVRALLDAIFGATARGAGSVRAVRRKDAQLRRLRDRIMADTRFGKALVDFVTSEAAVLSQAILEDEECFGLAVRMLEPWVRLPSNLDLLEAELDPETVANFGRLADRIGKQARPLRDRMAGMKAAVAAVEGMRVRELLDAGQLQQPRPRRRRQS